MEVLGVAVKNFEPRTVAYVRCTGDFQKNPELFAQTWGKLMGWAAQSGLMEGAETLCMFDQDPDAVGSDEREFTACITLKQDMDVAGEIGKMTVAGGLYASGHYKVSNQDSAKAWEDMFANWLPASGYQPDAKPCFQLYPNMLADNTPQDIYVCVPVRSS